MDWRLLQLADSAFPAGAFAHSAGLEALHQARLVSAASLLPRLRELTFNAARSMLPFVESRDDAACDAFLVNHVANRASRAQGGAFGIAAEAALGVPRPSLPFGHLPVVMGQMVGAQARELYLFGTARGALSAAVRLGIVGPLEAQRLFTALHPTLEAALAERGEARSTSPVLELFQQQHDTLYSRLFQS
ncbi:MAG: urease accessory protein UreF [Myxococcaceae bacterium]|nr:urease accessory protein UreF [Myxococcaceae bacterium]